MRRLLLTGTMLFAGMVSVAARAEQLYGGMETLVEKARALDAEGLEKIQVSAAAGDPEAKSILAFALIEGNAGLEANLPEAARLFGEAGEKNHVSAQLMMATMHVRGEGVPQDSHRAYDYLLAAAEHRSVEAFFMLASMSKAGDGTASSMIEARKWARLAAMHTQDEGKRQLFGLMISSLESVMSEEDRRASDQRVAQWLAGRRR